MGTGIDFVTVYAPPIFGAIFAPEPSTNATAAAAAAAAAAAPSPPERELLYTLIVGCVFVAVTPLAVLRVDR